MPEAENEKTFYEILNVEDVGQIKGTDYINNLGYEFANDVLYKILQKSHRERDILTDVLREKLIEGKLYSTPEVARYFGIPTTTLRNWIQELEQYIKIEKQERNVKLTSESVYRLRMVQILRENNEYTITQLKKITLGEVITEEGENNSVYMPNKIDKLEKTVEELKQALVQQNQILFSIVDKKAWGEGKVMLNIDALIPLIGKNQKNDKLEEIEQKLEKIDEEIKKNREEGEAVNKYKEDIEKIIKTNEDEVKKYIATEVEEQVNASLEKVTKNNNQLTKEEIEEIYKRIEKAQNMNKPFLERITSIFRGRK